MAPLDVLLLVPTPPPEAYFLNADLRHTLGPPALQLLAASHELETFVGRDLGFDGSLYPAAAMAYRSLTAVALATHLELAGLNWAVIDPGARPLSYWRSELRRLQQQHPSTIAVSTTYFMSAEWLNLLLEMCREISPQATIIVGGYMYGTASKEFLSLRADLICVGEGETRLPLIVKACTLGASVDQIPGIYQRDKSGSLTYTGDPEPLKLSTLVRPDWMLSKRMSPAVDPETNPLYLGIETQRGCLFKCQFCTFRTLASPSALNVSEAVEAIFATAQFSKGSHIMLADPTATFPKQRWQDIMELLADSGGAPHPMFAYARVNDLDRKTVEIMIRANVREVFIGQESGDPDILAAMRKGTQLQHLWNCVAALSNSPINVTMGFIHGYPSETRTTMQATRSLIRALNDHSPQQPPVTRYTLSPFTSQDLASVSYDERLREKQVSPKLASEETLATFIASSRIPHAPLMFGVGPTSFIEPFEAVQERAKYRLFRWYKAVQRGVAIFLERELDGKAPNDRELRSVRNEIIASLRQPLPSERSVKTAVSRRLKTRVLRAISDELDDMSGTPDGLLTRLVLARMEYSAHRRILRALIRIPRSNVAARIERQTIELAGNLVSSALRQGKMKAAGSRQRILLASRTNVKEE